jgi:hypothetical protein
VLPPSQACQLDLHIQYALTSSSCSYWLACCHPAEWGQATHTAA